MSSGRPEGIVSDAVVLAAIGGAAAVAGTLWLWGGLAGAVFGSGWPSVGAGQLLGVLLRLPSRLPNPAGAWPPAVRAQLPGPGGFYAALAILILVIAFLIYRHVHRVRSARERAAAERAVDVVAD